MLTAVPKKKKKIRSLNCKLVVLVICWPGGSPSARWEETSVRSFPRVSQTFSHVPGWDAPTHLRRFNTIKATPHYIIYKLRVQGGGVMVEWQVTLGSISGFVSPMMKTLDENLLPFQRKRPVQNCSRMFKGSWTWLTLKTFSSSSSTVLTNQPILISSSSDIVYLSLPFTSFTDMQPFVSNQPVLVSVCCIQMVRHVPKGTL